MQSQEQADIEAIKERNRRVEADKVWETSWNGNEWIKGKVVFGAQKGEMVMIGRRKV